MGLYRAIGRPLFFALDPETAHSVAGAMLGWPLPWQRIGGASHNPRLRVNLAGIELANPVGLAAGFDKRCRHLDTFGRLGFGYAVGGTITWAPREGNPRPRVARTSERLSMTNAMGLPNPGAHAAAGNLERNAASAPRFVSLADEAVSKVAANHELLEPLVDAVELNVSCPNVSWGRDRDNEAHLAEVLQVLRDRRKPLFVKLPPFETQIERDVVLSLAKIAHEGGADGLTASNTRPVPDRRLSAGAGGVSGKELWPSTVRIVRELRGATGGALPINACGGIFTAQDALACIEAGATTVQVYTGLIYVGPRIVGDITHGLAEALASRATDVAAVVGAA